MDAVQTWIHDGKGWNAGEAPDADANPQRFHRVPGKFTGHGVTAELWTAIAHPHRDPAKDGWTKVPDSV